MTRRIFGATTVAISALAVLLPALATAQIVTSTTIGAPVVQTEYVVSSSPLPGGGVVTRTFYPTHGVQTVTAVASAPAPVVVHSPVRVAAAPTVVYSPPQPVATTQVTTLSPMTTVTPVTTLSPATTVTPVTTWSPVVPRPATTTVYQVPAAAQVPSLGIPHRVVAAPTTQFVAPATPIIAAETHTVLSPTISYPTPVLQTQALRPLVQFQNLPAGTYVGQGVLGTPRAYVDGQPVRNLLRFLVP